MTRRFRELAERSWSRGIPCYTDFLDLSEQTVLTRIRAGLPQPEIRLFGGAEGCERVMAGFGVSDPADAPIACLRVSPPRDEVRPGHGPPGPAGLPDEPGL